MKRSGLALLFLLGMAALASQSPAQMPRTMSFQGVLANATGTLVPDGNYAVTLRLYEAMAGGAPVYSENHVNVAVVNGIMNVIIGSVTPLPQNLQFNRAYFLGISINSGTELAPRTALTAAPYALNAAMADLARGLAPGATGVVTSLNGGDGTLQLRGGGTTTINRSGSTITISSGGGGTGIQGVQSPGSTIAVTDANGPVASIDLADDAVTTGKIANGAVTRAKLGSDVIFGSGGKAGGDLTGDYPDPTIAVGAVGTEKITDGTITGDDVNPTAKLRIESLIATGNVGIGTDAPEAHLTVHGPGGTVGTGSFLVTNSAKRPLIFAAETGNVGIGTTVPQAALEVQGQGPLGLWVSHGTTVFSYVQMPATPSPVSIPDNATVVRITNDNSDTPTFILMPQARQGQIMIVTNDDAQTIEIPPNHPIAPGQTRMFVNVGPFWRVVQ